MSVCFPRLGLASTATQSRLSQAQWLVSPLSCVFVILCPSHRMCLMRSVWRACAALSLPGRLLLMCVLLDTLYLACLQNAAVIPSVVGNGSDSETQSPPPHSLLSLSPDSSLLDQTSSHSAASSLSPLAPAAEPPQLPPAALSSRSSSSPWSSSSHDSDNSSSDLSETNLTVSDHERAPQNHQNNSDEKSTDKKSSDDSKSGHNKAVSSQRAGAPTKEFPMALVVASSSAAVSILLFFCLSYIWHTRQLDRRAQKLAIRLAADSDGDVDCSQCRTPTTYMAGSSQDSGTDSGGEELSALPPLPTTIHDDLNSLNEEDEEDAGEDGVPGGAGGRRKPGGVGRTLGSRRNSRGRGRRSGSRSSRKWSGHGGQTRSSLVTDQEILNHFASRRHSTFFI